MLKEGAKVDNRKKKILQAIIEEYINTAEPVSSGSIVKRYGLDFSSATIRNEMAELEKVGYIEKTHTSSGRIPSAKGYRLYVDELLNDQNINLAEIKYIQSKLNAKVVKMSETADVAIIKVDFKDYKYPYLKLADKDFYNFSPRPRISRKARDFLPWV